MLGESYKVTKKFREVLPEVKGHRWEILYYPDGISYLGNVAIYLWSKKFGWSHDIMGSAYVSIRESHTPLEVQEIVLRGVRSAMHEAENKTPKGIPSNILNQPTNKYME